MAFPWLMIAAWGLAAIEVSRQQVTDFANPPPLPTAGRLFLLLVKQS